MSSLTQSSQVFLRASFLSDSFNFQLDPVGIIFYIQHAQTISTYSF